MAAYTENCYKRGGTRTGASCPRCRRTAGQTQGINQGRGGDRPLADHRRRTDPHFKRHAHVHGPLTLPVISTLLRVYQDAALVPQRLTDEEAAPQANGTSTDAADAADEIEGGEA